MSEPLSVILSTARNPQPDSRALEEQILAALERRPDVKVTLVPHLYDLESAGAGMETLRLEQGPMIVLAWLYPRAAYWVLSANGVRGRLGRTTSLPEGDVDESGPASRDPVRPIWCFDLRTHDLAEVYLEEIGEIIAAARVPASEATAAGDGKSRSLDETTRTRWYPVIDYDRCTNCLECLNFCLFGVFGLDEQETILIEQPDACRAGCPACSRICPAGAIMFPQHKDPAIAGDPQASLEGLKLDLSQLFTGGAADLAAGERDRALAEQQTEQEQEQAPAEPDGLDHLVDELDDMDL